MMSTTDSTPLVAIVTPVYNGERFIAETMACVQQQDYPNIVHIILDNACTDATPEILNSFKNQRVPIIVHRNPATLPMIDNHNSAIKLVPPEAKYFRNLCADDLMHPSAIRRKVAIAESDPQITVVGCQWRATGLCGSELPRDRDVFDPDEIIRWYLQRKTSVLSGTHTLFRTASVDFSGPFYDAQIDDSWDSETNLRLVMQGRYGFVHDELAIFRMHELAHTASVASIYGTHFFEWLILLDRYGPRVMSTAEYKACRKAYRRHLLRRALLSRWRTTDRRFYEFQMKQLAQINDSPGILDFVDALADWGLLAIKGKRHQVGMSSAAGSNSLA
jgi:glycosyltransferase involved in cell wall biosynthesis